MRTLAVFVFIVSLMMGCAHQDLKAPCKAFNANDTVPCQQPVPINIEAAF